MLIQGIIKKKEMITDKEGMKWLRVRLERVDVLTFKNTELYKLLKKALGEIGYWKMLPRGNPMKGYLTMRKNKKR